MCLKCNPYSNHNFKLLITVLIEIEKSKLARISLVHANIVISIDSQH